MRGTQMEKTPVTANANASSPTRDGSSTMYGSFSFPTPPLAAGSATSELARREADLAQREREISERERKVQEDSRTFMGFEVGALRHVGRPLWRDAPPQWQLLCKRMWQLWAATAALFVWRWWNSLSSGFSSSHD